MNVLQRGFTLIEILVAVVILAFGLLGIAGLQLSGVRATQSSAQRSTAVSVMNEVAEKIHANQPGAKAGLYKNYDTNTASTFGGPCTTAPAAICAKENGAAAPTGCTAAQLATYDRFVLACGTPNGSGVRAGGINSSGAGVFPILPDGRLRIQCVDAAGVDVAGGACPAGMRYHIFVTWTDRGDLYQVTGTSSTSYTNTTGTAVGMTVDMWLQP